MYLSGTMYNMEGKIGRGSIFGKGIEIGRPGGNHGPLTNRGGIAPTPEEVREAQETLKDEAAARKPKIRESRRFNPYVSVRTEVWGRAGEVRIASVTPQISKNNDGEARVVTPDYSSSVSQEHVSEGERKISQGRDVPMTHGAALSLGFST